MGLSRSVEPASLPVLLADAKKQCEIGDSDTAHDDHITRLIEAATRDVERLTRRALITQTWVLTLPEFRCRRLLLPRPPLQSVSSVVYVDDDGDEQTLGTSLYQVASNSSPAFIEPAYGQEWPVARTETVEAVTVTYVAGFGDGSTDVPSEYQNVILELVAFRFMNRGDASMDIPKHIRWSLDSLKCGAKYDYYGIKG